MDSSTTKLQFSLDPLLLDRQLEYESLCLSDEYSFTETRKNRDAKQCFSNLTTGESHWLAALWISDGIHARAIDYPKSNRQLYYISVFRSPFFRTLYNILVILQILAPLFENPYCGLSSSNNEKVLFTSNGLPTRLCLIVLDVFCVMVYSLDLYLAFAINPSEKVLWKKPWTTIRLFCCIALMINILLYFSNATNTVLVRSLFPLFFISRRNNLKLMTQGLLISGYYSMNIIKGLLSVLILWGFTGYFMFRNSNESLGRFNSPWESIATCLHCFTSRPINLKIMYPFFTENSLSPLFFVTLILAADLLCINLIVATGSRQYKLFAADILKKRLIDRKRAFNAVFDSFAVLEDDDVLRMPKKCWMGICKAMKLNNRTADLIFQMEDISGEGISIDRVGFFRMCALLASKVTINDDDKTDFQRMKSSRITSHLASFAENREDLVVTRDSMCSMGRFTQGDNHDGEINDVGGSDGNVIESSTEHNVMISSQSLKNVNHSTNMDQSIELPIRESMEARARRSNYKDPKTENASRASLSQTSGRRSQSSAVKKYVVGEGDNPMKSSYINDTYEYLSISVGPSLALCLKPVVTFCRFFFTVSLVFDISAAKKYKARLSDFLTVLTHMLLVIQLAEISSFHARSAWFDFGTVLEVWFWMVMLMDMIGFGYRHYFSQLEKRLDFIVNMISLVVLTIVHNSSNKKNLLILIITQSFRMFKLFFIFNDFTLFEAILPVLARGLFIFFAVIYFFAIFAHTYFCNAFDDAEVVATNADDDSMQWTGFSTMLTFQTYPLSLFTLFETGILGNWSIVMDGMIRSKIVNPYSAYVFFYVYRLTITLLVLPILLSFVMQAFLSAIARKSALESSTQSPISDSTTVDSSNTCSDKNDDKEIEPENTVMKENKSSVSFMNSSNSSGGPTPKDNDSEENAETKSSFDDDLKMTSSSVSIGAEDDKYRENSLARGSSRSFAGQWFRLELNDDVKSGSSEFLMKGHHKTTTMVSIWSPDGVVFKPNTSTPIKVSNSVSGASIVSGRAGHESHSFIEASNDDISRHDDDYVRSLKEELEETKRRLARLESVLLEGGEQVG